MRWKVYLCSEKQKMQEEMNKITTLVFDLDGTLLDTLRDLADSVNYALTQYHYPLRSTGQVRRALGNGVQKLMEASVPDGLTSAEFDAVFSCFKAHYVQHSMDNTAPYDGIIDMLRSVREQGYRCAIVSNKLDPAVQDLNRNFFSRYMDVAIGESPSIRRKPAPDSVLEALRRMGSTIAEALYIGDSEVDMATARNASLPCLSVTWGFRDESFLKEQGAAHIVHRPAEILSWLKENAQVRVSR